jgi:WD40 repeat protein
VVLDTDTLTERWTGDPNANWPLALNGDGSLLLVEGVTGVEVWDIDAGEAIDTLPSPGAQPRGHFRPQDDAVVVKGGDTTLTLWDTQSGEQLGTYRAIGGLWPQSFGGRIGVVDESGDVPALVIVDPRPRGEPLAVDLCADADERNASAVPAGNFSVLDGRPLLIAGCEDGERSTTVLLDAESGTADLAIDGNIGYQQAVSPDRQRLARQERLDGPDGLLFGPVTIRDLETGEVLATMDPVCEEYDPAPDDYSWYESDPASGCPAEHVYMNLLDWSPDGRYLVGGGVVPTVVWDATTGEVAKLMISDGELGPWDYVFSPDGERLLVSLIDLAGSSAIDVYSTETWELLREVPFPKDLQPLPRLAGWSPDGSTLYVTGQAAFGFGVGRLDRLDGETLEQQGPPMRLHEGGIVHDALAPDGTRLATVAETGELRIWDLAERSLVHEIELDSILPDQPPAGVGWKDDTHILVVTEPGMLVEFTTDADELIALVKESLTRGFTDAECVRYGIDPCPSLDEMRGP